MREDDPVSPDDETAGFGTDDEFVPGIGEFVPGVDDTTPRRGPSRR